jgi:hypothetical protein
MDHAIDALIEIFTWVGFGAFLLLAIAVVVAWAADGTWLPAEAIIDRDGGDPSSAGSTQTATPTVRRCPGRRRGHRRRGRGVHLVPPRLAGRMRLQRRPAGLRALTWSAAGMLALGVVSLVAGWVLFVADERRPRAAELAGSDYY